MSHPDLDPDEKFIWIWLVIQCANTTGNTTSLTYETLSHAVNKPPKTVHRSLLRLRIMGFLNGNIPIWYGEPTTEMMNEMRTLRPIPLSCEDYLEQLTIKKELEKKGLIWRTYDNKPILINLNSKAEVVVS
jgi:hypothetical protein